ncbi:MAG: hypothetical protein Q7S69_04280, partial [Nitrosomonadaceae bacterium]|nr:hypothetical protein [Nitrosomonadaceae bacterium]
EPIYTQAQTVSLSSGAHGFPSEPMILLAPSTKIRTIPIIQGAPSGAIRLILFARKHVPTGVRYLDFSDILSRLKALLPNDEVGMQL